MLKSWRPFAFGLFVGLLSAPLILLLNQRQTTTPIELLPPLPTATQTPIRVHLTGAVNAPGVYELPRGSILQDALNAAGGLKPSADSGRLNLAKPLNDGEQIVIPEAAAPGQPTFTPDARLPLPTTPPDSAAPATLININTATQAELESLPEIGPATAQRILEYREANGPFNAVEDLLNVKGIGPATIEAIKPFVTIK
jgi:competence protein ComEA